MMTNARTPLNLQTRLRRCLFGMQYLSYEINFPILFVLYYVPYCSPVPSGLCCQPVSWSAVFHSRLTIYIFSKSFRPSISLSLFRIDLTASSLSPSKVQTRLFGASGIVWSNAYVPGWWYPSRLWRQPTVPPSFDNMCAVPRTHNSFGERSFGAADRRIWNSLPRGLLTLDISYKHFKTLLCLSRPRRLWHWHISALEVLTYLLT